MTVKIFQILGEPRMNTIEEKLRQNRRKKEQKINPIDGELVELKITLDGLKNEDQVVSGVMNYDVLETYKDRNGDNYQIKTRAVDFTFLRGSGAYLIVYAGSKEAQHIFNIFSRLVFFNQDNALLPCDIPSASMENFLDENPHRVFRCTWDGLNIPGLTGTDLKGGQIESTQDFNRYDTHGMKKSIQFNLLTENITLSMNREANIHFYTRLDKHSMEQFIRERIIPICR